MRQRKSVIAHQDDDTLQSSDPLAAASGGCHTLPKSYHVTISADRFAGIVAQCCLLMVVIVAPWALGAVEARYQVFFFPLAAVAALCWLVSLRRESSTDIPLPASFVPLLLAVALAVFQLMPLSSALTGWLSPQVNQLRANLLGAADSSSVKPTMAIEPTRPISLYPAATRRNLALLLMAVSVFVLAARFFRRQPARVWLLALLTANGAALAFFGLIQKLSFNGMIYWSVPLTRGGMPFGPFVNRNHAGSFLNLSLAAALGLLLWALADGDRPDWQKLYAIDLPARTGTFKSRLRRVWQQVLSLVGNLDVAILAPFTAVVFIIAGVLCTLSRVSILSLVGGACITVLATLTRTRRGPHVWLLSLSTLAAVLLVSWLSMSDMVGDRLATLFDRQSLSDEKRIEHWSVGLQSAAEFWPLGSGLGTYRYVYPRYDEQAAERLFYHAENQYLESLVDGGIVGLGLMLATICLVAAAALRLLSADSKGKSAMPLAVAGIFALSSQAIHSFFDFALYTPANALLMALICGAVAGSATLVVQDPRRRQSRLLSLPRVSMLNALAVAGLLAALAFGWKETRTVAAVETAISNTRELTFDDDLAPEHLRNALGQIQAATRDRWDDAEAHMQAVRIWVELYRALALTELRQEYGDKADEEQLRELTSPVVLHAAASRFGQANNASALEQLRRQPTVLTALEPARRHAELARDACPLLSQSHFVLAQLAFLAGDPRQDLVHLQRTVQLVKNRPSQLYWVGVLHMNASRHDQAYSTWRQCWSLDPGYEKQILAQTAAPPLGVQEMLDRLFPPDPEVLLRLAKTEYAAEKQTGEQKLLLARAEQLLDTVPMGEDRRSYLRGTIHLMRDELPEAVKDYQRAVDLNNRTHGWRYELAVLLNRLGRVDEAHEHAKKCVRMDPKRREYEELLKEIYRQPSSR